MRIADQDKRTRNQRIWMLPEDWEAVARTAAAAGVPATSWVRDAALEAAAAELGVNGLDEARRRAPKRRNWNPPGEITTLGGAHRSVARSVRFSQHEWNMFTDLAGSGTPSEWVREAALAKLAATMEP